MNPTDRRNSKQTKLNDDFASHSATTSISARYLSRSASDFENNLNLRNEQLFPANYYMHDYTNQTANTTFTSEPQNVNQKDTKERHQSSFSQQQTDPSRSASDMYSMTNAQHSYPSNLNHPINEMYDHFLSSQNQTFAFQTPQHNLIRPSNSFQNSLHAQQASQLQSLNRPLACVCAMMGQSHCICGFAESQNHGIHRFDGDPSAFNNATSYRAAFTHASPSQNQPWAPQEHQSERNDNSSTPSTVSIVAGGRSDTGSQVQLGHPSAIYLSEEHPSLTSTPNDHPWHPGEFKQPLYGAIRSNDVLNMASTNNSYHNIASSSTSSAEIAYSQGPNTNDYQSEATRWNAVVQRSHIADSQFVYGSHSTRIYCRPSCSSKQPERGKVVYFMSPDAAMKAENAGYRACKRCKPGTQGVADACVLAVGECLRHMTRAAILGESEEVDGRMKKRTLKQYSSDFGVSAFHFHRTLKKVSTMTPGEYGQICHALVLQDELGIDKTGVPLEPEELKRKLRGWSPRRARRALGNVLPMIYASGMVDLQMAYVVAKNTPYGCVVALYGVENNERQAQVEVGSENVQISLVGLLIGEDSIRRVNLRCPRAVCDYNRSQWLHSIINDLHAKGTREIQMPAEVIPWLRRVRAYVAVKKVIESFSSQKKNK